MLTLLLRRVLPGRLIPLLGLWELYTAARWLNGMRTAAQRREHEADRWPSADLSAESQAPPRTLGLSSHPDR